MNIFYILSLASLFLVATLSAQTAHAAQATLAWDASSDTSITGYKIYSGTQSNQYSLLADVGKTTSRTVTNLQAGSTYYFAVTAYNTQSESAYSNEVTVTVPAGCTYSITPASKTLPQTGGTGTVGVTTQSSCTWTATSGAPSWLTITSGSSGAGTGSVGYSVSANTGSASRTAASTIAGQAFTVTQAGQQTGTNAYTITASAGTGGSISPSGSVSVNAGSSQSFTFRPNYGYSVSYLVIDGARRYTSSTSYTFSNVQAKHSISVYFARRWR